MNLQIDPIVFAGPEISKIEEYRDGVNAGRQGADDYKKVTHTVTNATKLTIKLAEGGGWAATPHPAGMDASV